MRSSSPLALAVLLAGCTPTDEEPTPTTCGVFDLTVETSPLVDQVVRVSWSSGLPAEGVVEYALPGGLHHQRVSEGTVDHVVDVIGLKAGADYDMVAISRCDGGGDVVSELLQLQVPLPHQDMPRLEIPLAHLDQVQPAGWFLVTFLRPGDSWVVLLDRKWDPAWAWTPGEGLATFTAELSRDGASILHSQSDSSQVQDLGATVRVGLDGRSADEVCNYRGHHDFAELPGGEFAYLSVDTRTGEVEGEELNISGDAVLETRSGGDCDEDTRVFSFFDLYDPWPYATELDDKEIGGGKDWTHCNSLLYDDEDEAYLVMSRNLDALLKIDRRTGEVLWQMGGADSDFTFAEPEHAWSHGHLSQVWDGGMMVFDNGDDRDPPVSRVMEYAFDEQAMTVEAVWEHPEPSGLYVSFLGDAWRLPGGNTVVSWGSLGRITEITPDHREVMVAEVGLGAAVGRIQWFREVPGQPEVVVDPVDFPSL